MNNNVEGDSANRGKRRATAVEVTMLRAEIAFWRDMLASAGDSMPSEGMERMRYALALAEYRLMQLTGACPRRDGSTAGPPATSPEDGKFLH